MSTQRLSEITHKTYGETETRQLGADIAMIVKPGDLLALSGDLGAGKSTFARGLIRHLLDDDAIEISSPTYTLCNVYPTQPAISHFDFYRLGSPDEIEELGFYDALDTGCALVEWPENGFEDLPAGAVLIQVSEIGDESREFLFSGNQDLLSRIKRTLEIRELLEANGMGNLVRIPLDGDASARCYEKLHDGQSASHLLMDAPAMPDGPPVKHGKPYSQIAHIAEDVTAFLAIAKELSDKGLAAPAIPAMDLERGLLMVENLGGDLIIDENRVPIDERYIGAVELLAKMHEKEFASEIALPDGSTYSVPAYDRDAMIIEVELLLEWYLPSRSGKPVTQGQRSEFLEIWDTLIKELAKHEKSLVLRDYHSPNIIWREDEAGTQRIGLIDFQDAVIGPSAYDVASLAQDARVDVSQNLETSLIEHYIRLRTDTDSDFQETGFRAAYSIMAAQRATKVLGIFVRLNDRDGKSQYLNHISRVEDYLRRSVKHPALGAYNEWLKAVIDL